MYRLGVKLKDIIKFGINALSNIVNGSANAIFALVLPPLLLHKMQLDEYSLWSYCLQTGALIGYLNLGVQTAVGRYVALYTQENNKIKVIKTIKIANSLLYKMFVLGVIVSITLSFFINDLIKIDNTLLRERASIVVFIVSLGYTVSLLTNSYFGYFIGIRKNHIPMWLNLISKIILGVAIVAIAKHGVIFMSFIFLIVNLVTVLCLIIYWKKTFSIKNKLSDVLLGDRGPFVRFCLSLAVWNLGMLLVSGMNTSIVGYFSFRDVAYFTIANGLVMALVGFLSSGLNPLIQVFTGFHVNKNKSKLAVTIVFVTRLVTVLMLLSFIMYHFLRDDLLSLWLSKEYRNPVGDFINLLIIGACIRLMNIPYALALIATNNQSKALYGALFEGVVNITLAILFCWKYGVYSIAYAMIISSIIATLYNVFINMRYTFDDIPIYKMNLISFEIVFFIIVIISYYISQSVSYSISVLALFYSLYSLFKFFVDEKHE